MQEGRPRRVHVQLVCSDAAPVRALTRARAPARRWHALSDAGGPVHTGEGASPSVPIRGAPLAARRPGRGPALACAQGPLRALREVGPRPGCVWSPLPGLSGTRMSPGSCSRPSASLRGLGPVRAVSIAGEPSWWPRPAPGRARLPAEWTGRHPAPGGRAAAAPSAGATGRLPPAPPRGSHLARGVQHPRGPPGEGWGGAGRPDGGRGLPGPPRGRGPRWGPHPFRALRRLIRSLLRDVCQANRQGQQHRGVGGRSPPTCWTARLGRRRPHAGTDPSATGSPAGALSSQWGGDPRAGSGGHVPGSGPAPRAPQVPRGPPARPGARWL